MKTKSSIVSWVALVVGLLALGCVILAGIANTASVNKGGNLGGVYNVNSANPTFTNGVDFGNLPVNINWVGGKIGAKTNTAYWKNTTATTKYVTYAEASTDGTASSSFKVYAYSTSTAPRTLYDFTAPSANASTNIMINAFALATSSTATTTSSDDTRSGGPVAGSTVQVPVGSYFVFLLQSTGGAGCASQGGSCESATSTNRGFNVPWRLEYHN